MAMCVAVSMMALQCPSVIAQTGKAENPERPAINFRVLQGWKVDLGDHAIFLNRVAPPVLPPAPPPPPPAPAPSAVEIATADKPEAGMPQKKTEVLFLSATVFDRQVTEVRTFGGKRDCRFLISIDFNLLAGVGSLETADTDYLLILGVGNETRGEAEAFNKRAAEDGQKDGFKQIPPLESFSKNHSEYVVAQDEPDAQPPAETLAALDALLVFYDANRSKLAEDYAKREAARSAQKQWVKEHPPAPRDTVIHYWKKDSIPTPSGAKEKR